VVFLNDNRATVYYLPGTLGWDSTFGDRPTAPWLPEIQFNRTGFGVQTNQFGFKIIWADNKAVVVEACTDLATPVWVPLTTMRFKLGVSVARLNCFRRRVYPR
jgi:hypothetical protein